MQEAYKEHAISGIYKDHSEAEKFIQAFSKEFAKRAEVGAVLGEIKRKLHHEIITICDDVALSAADVIIVQQFIKDFAAKEAKAKL